MDKPERMQTLLIVDDRPDNLVILQSVLQQFLPDLKVVTALEGPAGLALARKEPLAGALIDVQMPGMDGVTLCQAIRHDPQIPHLPIILITAHAADTQIKVRGLAAGADDFISRPIDNEELVARVKVMLRISKAERTLLETNRNLEQLVEMRTQEARNTMQHLTATMNSMSEAVVSLDADGKIVNMNHRAESLTGWTITESYGKPVAEVLLLKDPLYPGPDGVLEAAKESCAITEFGENADLINRRGQSLPVEGCAGPILCSQPDTPDTLGTVYVFHDISARKHAAMQIQSLWEVASLVDASLTELCAKVLEVVLRLTQSQYSFFGFLNEEESMLTIHAWSHQVMDDCAIHDKPIHLPIAEAGIWANAVRERKSLLVNRYEDDHPQKHGLPAGHLPLTRLIAVPVFSGGRIVALAACANKELDYTEADIKTVDSYCSSILAILQRRKVEEEQRLLEEQLRQGEKMQAIGQLAGGIAHDFNNQLAGVLGYGEMLFNRLEDPILSSYAENVCKAARRAADLTKQLLAFSRKGKNLSIPVEINKVLAEVVSVLEHSIDKRIEIVQNLRAWPCTTVGDPTQIQNSFLNLAINARDAMPNGGQLIFETSVIAMDSRLSQLPIFEIPAGQYLKISVTDSGTGMDKATQARIFEPFFTTKEEGKGTGMGLASVYGTIKNHHGAIAVYSEPGHGTTFDVYLPFLNQGAENSLPVIPATVRGNARLLLVDDEEIIRQMGSDMLRELGYKVMTCTNGREAVEYYRKCWQDIDLVVLDMIMPKLNGREAFIAMRELNPAIRAILASGYSLNEEAQAILDNGVRAFVGKPFEMAQLSNAVALALQ